MLYLSEQYYLQYYNTTILYKHKGGETVRDTRLIKSAYIAKQLLQLGYTIKDIKPHNRDNKRTVFIFIIEDNFNNDLERIERRIESNNGKSNENQKRENKYKYDCNTKENVIS